MACDGSERVDRALLAIWPKRSQQELLLDLGERKSWDDDARRDAVRAFARWLREEMLVPWSASHASTPTSDRDRVALRELGERLPVRRPQAAVARWIVAFAEVLAIAPKTLANSLSNRLQTARSDHRWLRLIARVVRGGATPEAWAFHQRTPASVANALARLASPDHLDAGDETLLLSLIALWHRRRPPSEVRANLRRTQPRRITPKPIVGLSRGLITQGRFRGLLELARQLQGEAGRAIATLATEAALWEAHLAPHVARRGGTSPRQDGRAWLSTLETVVRENPALLDAPTLAFRIERMRAYDANAPQPESHGGDVSNAYVEASLTLERARAQPQAAHACVDPHAPGVFMLIPLLRSRGLLVVP